MNEEKYKKLVQRTIELNFQYTKASFRSSLFAESIKQDSSIRSYLILVETIFRVVDLFLAALFNADSKDKVLYIKEGKVFKCTSEGLIELLESEISNLVLSEEPKKEE